MGGGFGTCPYDGGWRWWLLEKTLRLVSGKDTGAMDERYKISQAKCYVSSVDTDAIK